MKYKKSHKKSNIYIKNPDKYYSPETIRKTNMFEIYAGSWFFIADFDEDDDLDIVISSKLKKTLNRYLDGVELMIDNKKFRVFFLVKEQHNKNSYSTI